MFRRLFYPALLVLILVSCASAQLPTTTSNVTAGSFLVVYNGNFFGNPYTLSFQLAVPGYSIDSGAPDFTGRFNDCAGPGCLEEEIVSIGKAGNLLYMASSWGYCWGGTAGFDSTRISHHINPKTRELIAHGSATPVGALRKLTPDSSDGGCYSYAQPDGPLFNLVGKWHWTAHFTWSPALGTDGGYYMTDLLITYHDDDDLTESQ